MPLPSGPRPQTAALPSFSKGASGSIREIDELRQCNYNVSTRYEMVKTLKKVGNSYALPVDKSMMEALNISPGTPLMVTIHEGVLTVVAANIGFSDDEIDEFFADIRPKYDKMLKNLAK